MNLSQAEAIRDLINAQTEAAARQAARQVNGELSNVLTPLKDRMVEVVVHLESALEFVEDDLPTVKTMVLQETLRGVSEGIRRLALSFKSGRLLTAGARVTILGLPNVGKSSLFNELVRSDRAIVTDKPGTTRDTLTETIDLKGVPVAITDTAGLRATTDVIESMGIERTQRAMSDADLLLVVLDSSQPVSKADEELLEQTSGHRRVIVQNKCDLVRGETQAGLNVSARTGAGVEDLRIAILTILQDGAADDGGALLVTNARHHDLLVRAGREVDTAIQALGDRLSEELILASLHNALRLFGEITGETTTENILSEIFATFCIGK
jgi:tRNA modification GTPase